MIKIITDSTSDLPKEIAEELGIIVIPLNVHFGDEVYKDGVDIFPDEFYPRLEKSAELPKTSQPSIGDFINIYKPILDNGDQIISIHVSSKLSGTFNSASQAKSQLDENNSISIIDTKSVSMGVGLISIYAAKLIKSENLSLEEATKKITDIIDKTETIALVETLEFLQKGGRISKAKELIGNLLKVRPILKSEDGIIVQIGRERSRNKGISFLEQSAKTSSPLQYISIMYSTTPDEAQNLADKLRSENITPIIARLGPVIGTYAGPQALAIALISD
ncbi:MAG: DegV family protein [SAR202 cluster bacterium]|jgi:DegV family protein with EDD domain|nr:DegV family protein [SAR202 cluster bacterium]